MNVTFMIGNGFDLRLGMRTRYADMYTGYVDTLETEGEKKEVIRQFKRRLKMDGKNMYRNWSDFEMAMAMYAQEFEDEDDFIMCVRDFKEYMAGYLKAEEEGYFEYLKGFPNRELICIKEFGRAISEFYYGQIPNDVNKINKLSLDFPFHTFNFISFNYTKILDYFLKIYKEVRSIRNEEVLHIHGSLGKDVVLGVDSVEQFGDLQFKPSRKLNRAFVKPLFNSTYDNARVEQAKKIINQSNVICVYGMSFGESDRTWINCICDWLLEKEQHHLIYFQYSEDVFSALHSDRKMDEEEDRKEELLKKMFSDAENRENVFEQVHIPVGFDIFDFSNKLEESKEELPAEA